jgi:hypothetical protein
MFGHNNSHQTYILTLNGHHEVGVLFASRFQCLHCPMTVGEGTNRDHLNMNALGDREGFGVSEYSEVRALGGAQS